tara:strand:- start:17 stop:574 length:558 start_codon:yes stop_codon:yes gene_type:complete
MGAQIDYARVKASSMAEAWRKAQSDAKDEHGHEQGYSGSLYDCELDKDVTKLLKTMSSKDLDEYIEENVGKRDAWGYCVKQPKGNSNKIKSVVTNFPQKGTRKWATEFLATDPHASYNEIKVRAKNQTQCIKEARAYVEKNPHCKLEITIIKKLTSGITKCAEISYKQSSDEQQGTYVFIGLAPY